MKNVKKMLAVLICLSCVVLLYLFFQKAYVVEAEPLLQKPMKVSSLASIFGYAYKNPISEKSEVIVKGTPLAAFSGIIPLVLLIGWVNRWDSLKKDLWLHVLSIVGIIADFYLLGTLKDHADKIADSLFGEITQTSAGYSFARIMLIVLAVLVIIHAVVSFAIKPEIPEDSVVVSADGKTVKKKSSVKTLITALSIIAIVILLFMCLMGGMISKSL